MARRRRDGRRESNIYQIFVISPSVIFLLKNDSSLVRGSLCWTAARAVPTVRRRLHRIVRNSLLLFLTHYATPPFPQKSRSARLFGCKRPHDGSLSLPTFADFYIAFSRKLHISTIIKRREQAPALHCEIEIVG